MFCWRKFKVKLQRGLSNCLNITKTLYFVNVLLIFCLIYVLQIDDNESFRSTSSLLTVDKYRQHVESSMQIFEYMQVIKSGQLTKTEPTIEKNVNEIWCWKKYPSKPRNDSIIWNAELWQVVSSSDKRSSEIYIYSAYYDTRADETIPGASSFVQIFAMVQEQLTETVYCQIWYDDDDEKRPLVTRAIAKHIWEKAWDPRTRFYVPFIFTCPIRKKNAPVPKQVSMTTNSACQIATNLLRVNYDRLKNDGEQKKHTVICVKGKLKKKQTRTITNNKLSFGEELGLL